MVCRETGFHGWVPEDAISTGRSRRVVTRLWRRRYPLWCVLALSIASCRTPIGVDRIGHERVYRSVNANVLTNGTLGEFTNRTLARYGLTETFAEDPPEVIRRFHEIAAREKDREVLFALVELSYLAGADSGDRAHFFASAYYAYVYLFGKEFPDAPPVFDPRFRIICDLHNHALQEFLRDGRDIALRDNAVELPFAKAEIRFDRSGFPWTAEEFPRFVSAFEFRVHGLTDRYRVLGVGLPLIGIRDSTHAAAGASRFLGPRLKVPCTAFLRVADESLSLASTAIRATLELHPTFDTTAVEVQGQKVPLEADHTAPLAYGLDEGLIWDFEIGGFLSSEVTLGVKPGLFFLLPYVPGKIPVVFVHGTASSPARWAEMFNTLQSYPALRERYQWWFFLYNTGNPILYSGHLLREALSDALKTVDPEGKDAALRRMVLIGHSQGGLLARLQTIDSGDRFWANVTKEKTLDELDLEPEAKELARKAFFFQRTPSVERVIFVATPHRGSFLANRWYSRLAASFIRLPRNVLDTTRGLFRTGEARFIKEIGGSIPTSIRNMDPGNIFLQAINDRPIHPDVKTHSIIAIDGSGPIVEGNDGVVEYKSAHLDGALSEYVVFSGHSCQANPYAIQEARRILLEHIRGTKEGLRPQTGNAELGGTD